MLPPLFTAGSHQTASVSTAIGILSLKSFCCSSQFFTYPQQYFNVVNGCHSAAAYLHFCVRCRAPECIRRNRICASHLPATLCCAVVLLLLSFTAFASFLCLMRMSERFCFFPYFHNFDIILIIISGFSFVKTAFRCSTGSCGFSFLFRY